MMPIQEAISVLGKFRKKERDTVCTVSLLSYCLGFLSSLEDGAFHSPFLRYQTRLLYFLVSFPLFALRLLLLLLMPLRLACFAALYLERIMLYE